jgi:hypothetical protein
MRAVVLNLTAERTDPGHGTDLLSVKKEAARRSSRKRLSIPRTGRALHELLPLVPRSLPNCLPTVLRAIALLKAKADQCIPT